MLPESESTQVEQLLTNDDAKDNDRRPELSNYSPQSWTKASKPSLNPYVNLREGPSDWKTEVRLRTLLPPSPSGRSDTGRFVRQLTTDN